MNDLAQRTILAVQQSIIMCPRDGDVDRMNGIPADIEVGVFVATDDHEAGH